MNFIDSMLQNEHLKKISAASSNYVSGYKFWLTYLFERAMRLFVWTGTGDVPPREIEGTLLMNGSGAVAPYKKTLAIFNGEYSGDPTIYYDVYKKYSVHSPIYSRVFTVDKDCVLIRNNALMNSLYPLCHRYAVLLSHTEVSLINTLINGRDSGGVPVASTEAQRKSLEEYRNSLCNGKVGTVLDPAFSGVQFIGVDKNTTLNIRDLMEVRTNLIDSFYNDIGVKTTYNKKGNMIADEISANDGMLLLNISDMLKTRQDGAEAVNDMFGTNWQVDIAPEIKEVMKNEREENAEVRDN